MEYYYFDASVVVKAYLWEVGTEDVLQVLRDSRADPPRARVITSRIAYTEAMSAAARREFNRELTASEADEISKRLLADFSGPVLPKVVLEPGITLIHHAAELTRQYRLRALDAIHLATALAARYSVPAGVHFQFASADARLNSAAKYESLDVFNPQSPVPAHRTGSVAPAV